MCHGAAAAHGRKSQEGQEGGPEGQHPSDGDGEDPLHPEQLPAVSAHEGTPLVCLLRERPPRSDRRAVLSVEIEKFFPHVLEKEKTRREGEPSSLSPEEFAFAREYMANTETYLKNVALKHMPPNLQKVDLLRAVPKPDLDSYVFLRVKERQENILVEPETDEQRDYVIDLEEGSQHLIRYKTIAPLVASGAVQLI
ncbi:DNA replication complex GINS protein SLD5 isoform X2 [Physeter macrocephalus]|uniref:DNA replication complex GINS protein SLD5 isoform X2 n=1 Tax=Physeter macrocephalus TaxID=9755 RepID=A0A2Y9FN81_PHYMC|nr:DNA replication complex GINS protein SLD5 isoform X2 [Physeter catodon]|eukprot:XP_007127067.1 DNA replication complex GINS protein SLD5 isoform X2 [Physeter catodon]